MLTFIHDCPHCGVIGGGFNVHGYYHTSSIQAQSSYKQIMVSLMAICNRCKGSIVTTTALTNEAHTMLHRLNNASEWHSLESFYDAKSVLPFYQTVP